MALAMARGGGAKAQPARRAGLGPTSRAPRWGRATTLAILASLIVLAIDDRSCRHAHAPHARRLGRVCCFAPMVAAAILAVLLIVQALRADGDARALADSEERFRLAVEAARCGIWEWDLTSGELLHVRHHRRDAGLGRRRRRQHRAGAGPRRARAPRPGAPGDPRGRRPTAPSTSRSASRGLMAATGWIDARGQAVGERSDGRLHAPGRRGARRHRGAHRPGARPGRRGAAAGRDRERARRPSCSGTARGGWCSATRTSAASSPWSRAC